MPLLLGEMSVQVLCPVFNWVVCLPEVEFFIYIFLETRPLSEVSLANIFSHMVGSLFILMLFSHAEAFYFDEISFVYSFLYVPCSRGHISENIAA